MASAAPTLRSMFDEAEVARIAIVDDGYDPPLPEDVVEGDWEALRAAIADADTLGPHEATFEAVGELPPYGDLRGPLAATLFEHLTAIGAAGPPADGADPVYDALAKAFRSFAGRKDAKRRQLAHVERIASDATGSDPARLQSKTPAAALVDYDLVFLDFFLGEETVDGEATDALLDAAREQARRIVKDTIVAVGDGRMPLFVLISSRANPDSAPLFRDEAELLASKFRFLTKGEFDTDRTKTEWILASLVRERDAGDAVEKLLHEWDASIKHAVTDLMRSVRRLDVTDYAYLQKYRLAEEKTSLLEYLTWLFNSYLGSFVESRLAQSPAELIAPIRDAAVPPATLQPMSEVPTIYSAVTMTKVKSFADALPAKILTGDLFVRRQLLQAPAEPAAADPVLPVAEGDGQDAAQAAPADDAAPPPAANDQQPEAAPGPNAAPAAPPAPPPAPGAEPPGQPDIVAAITPICDLIPGREKANGVLLMGGGLSVPGKAKAASSHLISVDRPGASPGEPPLSFQVDWFPKWPVAHPRGAFDGDGILGTDYVRIGRLRDLYAADLAQQMSGDLSRVGLPITPPFTHPLQVTVLVKIGRTVKRLYEASVTEAFAWELYSKKTGEKREAMIAVDLIWKLRAAAAEAIAKTDDPCRVLLDNPEILRPLTVPFDLKFKEKATPTTAGSKLVVFRDGAPPEKDEISHGDAIVLIHLSGPHAKAASA